MNVLVNSEKAMSNKQRKSKNTKATATSTGTHRKAQPMILVHLRDRIYVHLLGCERGEFGALEGVRHTTIAELARVFDTSESVIRRNVNTLFAEGGAGTLGDRVYPIAGYRMQPVAAKAPRETNAARRGLRTRRIAGQEITLATGVRYGARRPAAPTPNKPVTVSIYELPSGIGSIAAAQITLPDREAADTFMRRFNGRSANSRVW
jgi:hypothetical protein